MARRSAFNSASLTPGFARWPPALPRQRLRERRAIRARWGRRGRLHFGKREIDLRLLHVDARHLHTHAAGELVRDAAALADEGVPPGVEMKVVAAELGDVHETVDGKSVERDEETEIRHAA